MNISSSANSKRLSLKNLYLDPNNFRLIHEKDQINVDDNSITDRLVALRTMRLVCGDKNQNIQDLIDSFLANGYLPVDQIQVRLLADRKNYVVVEGNRRIAALKFLQNEYDNSHVDIGRLDPSIFSAVPVVLYNDANEVHHLVLMALKHISGNKKWGEWNQAKLLEKLKADHGVSEDNIRQMVGISKIELRRSLRALSLVQQYVESEYGDQFLEDKFALFREISRSGDLKLWLGWSDKNYQILNVKNADLLFSWLSREPLDDDEDDQDASIRSENFLEPVLLRRDDIRLLNEIINDERAVAYLTLHRDLNGAHRASNLIFKQRKTAALKSLIDDVSTLQQLTLDQQHIPDLEQTMNKLQSIIARTRGNGLTSVEQTQVFHDRLDEHFTALQIKSYRKLDGLIIDKLSRVNLFAGINNTGKTSLLEAIYLLVRQNDVDGILEVTRRRGKVSVDHVQAQWLSGQLPRNLSVSGLFDKKDVSVSIRTFDDNSAVIDRAKYLKSIEICADYADVYQESTTNLFQDRGHSTLAEGIKLLCPVVYSSPFFLNESQHHTNFYYKSMQSKALPKIFAFLQNNVLPGVRDVRLVDDLQRFLVDDKNFELAMDLTSYGEGLQRIFFISLTFAAAQNGVVLIDEFENAIHADLLSAFASHVLELAKLFNVQVFLTSHSKEAIDAFTEDLSQLDQFSFHALINRAEKIAAHNFTGPEFRKLLSLGDVDLRRAQ